MIASEGSQRASLSPLSTMGAYWFALSTLLVLLSVLLGQAQALCGKTKLGHHLPLEDPNILGQWATEDNVKSSEEEQQQQQVECDEAQVTLNRRLDEETTGDDDKSKAADQRPDKRSEQVVAKNLTPQASQNRLAEPILSVNEPKWMDVCNRGQADNKTWINLHIGLDNGVRHILHHRRRKRSLNGGQKLSLRKTSGGGGGNNNKLNELDFERNIILFKKPTSWSGKKTTFAISNKSQQRSQQAPISAAARSVQAIDKRGKSKIRYFVGAAQQSSSVQPFEGNSAKLNESQQKLLAKNNNSEPQQQQQFEEFKSLVGSLFAHDVKLSWLITGALNTMNNSRQIAQSLLRSIQSEPLKLADSDQFRARELRQQQQGWLPSLESLIISNNHHKDRNLLAGGFYQEKTRQLVTNLTHYLEFFSAALEQMTFEQRTLGKQFAPNYVSLEINLQKISCELDDMMKLCQFYVNKRQLFRQLVGKIFPTQSAFSSSSTLDEQLGELAFYYKHLIDEQQQQQPGQTQQPQRLTKRDMGLMGVRFESPLVRFLQEKKSNTTRANGAQQVATPDQSGDLSRGLNNEQTWKLQPQNMCTLEHVGREVMPLEQRRLRSNRERAFRDELILGELTRLLTSYESLLMSNFM